MTGIPLYNLPDRQRQVLHFIIRQIDDAGKSPTIEEVSKACEMTVAHAQQVLDALEKKGRIMREKGAHRSITVVS